MGDAPPTISARKLCWPELGWDHGVCAAKPPPPARGRASAWEIVLVSGLVGSPGLEQRWERGPLIAFTSLWLSCLHWGAAATVQWQKPCLAKSPGSPPGQCQPQTRAESTPSLPLYSMHWPLLQVP